MSHVNRPRIDHKQRPAWGQFLIGLVALALVWLVLLPRLATHERVRSHLRFLDERQIDAGAMFYTELEAMQPILQRLHRQRLGPEEALSAEAILSR